MAKTRGSSGLIAELFSFNLYKRSQGQKVRQVTALSIAIVFLIAGWSFATTFFASASDQIQYGIPTITAVLGAWLAYRIVNYPPSADFLINVQGELDKVSWPSWPQLWRATIVVLVVMIVLAASLFLFDVIWQFIFRAVGFLKV